MSETEAHAPGGGGSGAEPRAAPPDGVSRSSGEGGVQAPVRHPLNWHDASFYDEGALEHELRRVFEICHGCRRCFSLCQAFPTLFDAIDASATLELDSVDKAVFGRVVEHCYLCDMCYMTKCPYVPPHPWNVDFPHLMLRAKAVRASRGALPVRDRVLSSTDAVGRIAGIPVIASVVNAANRNGFARGLLEKGFGVDRTAPLPRYEARSARRRLARRLDAAAGASDVKPTEQTRGRVVLFATCYGNRNEPALVEDLAAVFEHNGIAVTLAPRESCCGMPKLELGDLPGVERLMQRNVPVLAALVAQGYDIVAPIPSCVLMFKQELPLLFAEDAQVRAVAERTFDPFEYLMLRHKAGLLRTDFSAQLGRISYHVPCHLRVQNIGLKTRDVLRLVPGTSVEVIERCSGHDGTYAVKHEYRAASLRIGRPVAERVQAAQAGYYASDCPMAGHQIESGLSEARPPSHPMSLLRKAYGI